MRLGDTRARKELYYRYGYDYISLCGEKKQQAITLFSEGMGTK